MSIWKYLTGLAGGVGGAFWGGPAGAATGASLGFALGNTLDGGNKVQGAYDDQRAEMDAAKQAYERYQLQAQLARQGGLQNQLSAFNGTSQALSQLYGQQYDPRVNAPNMAQNSILQQLQAAQAAKGGGVR